MPPTDPVTPPDVKKYFAQRDIVHNGKTIAAGDELPTGIPADSLSRLIKEKAVGESPLKETKVTTTPGKSKA